MNGDRIIGFGAWLAAMGVALGAFGAHGLRDLVEPEMLAIWETGVRYHFYHALGLVGLGLAANQRLVRGLRVGGWRGLGSAEAEAEDKNPVRALEVASWLFLSGIVLFSGSLYTMTLGGPVWLGALTPMGGLAFIAGWATFGWDALRHADPTPEE